MNRKRTENPADARAELPAVRTKPSQRANSHSLPFNELSPDEFEVACFLLLLEEHPHQPVYYFGKTGDAGRDIIYRTTSGTELIQCKRYHGNVGVVEVRAELAKLCTNLHSQLIPEAINKVSFYVSSDLTAEAQDMLDHQHIWVAASVRALTEHLGLAPDAELIKFASTWWPTFARETGATLTKRFELHPRLIEEFFSVRKVVDATSLVPISTGVHEIGNKVDLLLQLQSADALEKLRLIVAQTEAINPGTSITVESSSGETILRVNVHPDVGTLRAGHLSFPATDAGRRGAEKLNLMRETGSSITLEQGEFQWDHGIKLPWQGAEGVEPTTLTIEPQLPELRIAVRLECRRDGVVIATLPFAYLKVLRLGSKEAELVLDAERYAASFRMSLRWHAPSSSSLEFDLTNVKAEDSLLLGHFLLELGKEGASVTIVNLEQGDELATLQGAFAPPSEEVANSVRLLEHLVLINKTLGCSLRHPAEVDREDARTAAIIAGGIQSGRIADPAPAPQIFPVPSTQLAELISKWRANEPVHITVKLRNVQWPVFETVLEVGDVTATMVEARPEEALETVAARAALLGGEGTVDVSIVGTKMIYEFARWNRA